MTLIWKKLHKKTLINCISCNSKIDYTTNNLVEKCNFCNLYYYFIDTNYLQQVFCRSNKYDIKIMDIYEEIASFPIGDKNLIFIPSKYIDTFIKYHQQKNLDKFVDIINLLK